MKINVSLIIILCLFNCSSKLENELIGKLEINKINYKLGETIEIKEYIKNLTSNNIDICYSPTKSKQIFKHCYNGTTNMIKDEVTYYKTNIKPNSFMTIDSKSEKCSATAYHNDLDMDLIVGS